MTRLELDQHIDVAVGPEFGPDRISCHDLQLTSAAKHVLVVPFQKFLVWSIRWLAGDLQTRSVKWVVAPPIVVVAAQTRAHFETELGCDGEVASVEEPMEICSEQESIANIMRTVVGIRADVRRLEGGKRMLFSDGAGARVRVKNCNAKRGLSETRLHHARVAVTRTMLGDGPAFGSHGASIETRGLGEAGLPDAVPLAGREVVFDGYLRAWLPIGRLWNPGLRREEDRSHQLDTADVIGSCALIVADAVADVCDTSVHLMKGRAPIPQAECVPGEPVRKLREVSEVSESADRVVGGSEFEQERRELWRAKGATSGWCPEVELCQLWARRQEGIPAFIGDGDRSCHDATLGLCTMPSRRLMVTPLNYPSTIRLNASA